MPLWRVLTFLPAFAGPWGSAWLPAAVWGLGNCPQEEGKWRRAGAPLGSFSPLSLLPAAAAAAPSDPAAPYGRACGGQHSRRGALPGTVFLSSEVLDGSHTHT